MPAEPSCGSAKLDLTDPAVDPNPAIEKVIELGDELFRLYLATRGSEAPHYGAAAALMREVVCELMAAKNAIADSRGEW